MKKKKDEIFDTLKKNIIKPTKDLVLSLKDFFTDIQTTYTDRIQ